MKKHLYLSLLALLMLFFNNPGFSQTWVDMMQDPNANFYDIQAEFNSYWDGRPMEKGKGYKAFRRWEAFMEPRVYPTGDIKLPSQNYANYKEWEALNNNGVGSRSLTGNWTSMGPVGKPGGGGAGRVNFLRFDPTNSNTMYAGTPDGGLWKTTNGGTTWSTNTDLLAVIGCSDIAIHPTNTQIMYLATGDGDASDTYSIGVLKSTDGGATWNTLPNLSWTVSQGRTISRLLINPNNPQIVMAFTSNGIYRTTDGGTTWTQPTGTFTGIKSAEFKPGDPNTVYCAGTIFKRSTDGGVNWTTITTGLTGIRRLAIAVTDANPAYVYVLGAKSADSGFLGLIRSTDSGASFTTRMASTSTNNILGWDNGSDAGGQGWYDLAIAASPTNAEEVYTGGINIWRSTNGGTSFTLNSHWASQYSKPYVHADIHALIFLPGSGTTLFSGNDGGVFKTTNSGTTWTDISNNLTIAQQYKIGQSASNATLLLAGHQDNGTNRLSGSTWTRVYSGDGMECFIDWSNNNTMYASYVYGDYKRSTNGGTGWTTINTGLPTAGDWVAAWHQDPVTANTLYAGGRPALYKSTNQGTNWTALGTPTGTGDITDFVVAPSNTQIIYAIKTGANLVSKSTNGGTSFTSVSTGLPTSVAPTCITVSNTDPNIVYVTYSGYGATNKVYKSTNGGTSWTNLSTGLPNLPVNVVVSVNNSPDDAIYVGTDVGVYYKDNSTGWIAFNTGLPNVIVNDLEIYYPTGRLRAGTYGRGTWESDLYSSTPQPPVASFTAGNLRICEGQSVAYTNTSTNLPTSYLWTFAGGTPSSSTATNPSVVYNTAGVYSVTLTASNAQGSNSSIQTNYVTVLGSVGNALPLSEGFVSATFPPANWALINPDLSPTTWERTTTAGLAPTAGNCLRFDNYYYDDRGNNDEMRTPHYDLRNLSSATLTFDVSHAPYDATYVDGLEVLVSTNCESTFTSVYSKSGATLGTTTASTSAFVPTLSSQWRTETINLNSYIGQADVTIAFRNLAGYGNMIYIDNINLSGVAVPNPPVASFTSAVTTTCTGQTVQYTSTSTGGPTGYSWTFQGGTPATSTAQNPIVTYATAGSYGVTLTASNTNGSSSSNQSSYITVNATPSITSSTPASRCGTGTVTLGATASLGTLSWFTAPTGGSAVGTGTSYTTPSLSTTTTYYVESTNNGCTSTRTAVTATVTAVPTITSSTPASRCGTGTVVLGATGSAGTLSWFTAPTGGSAVGTGTSYTTPSISTTTTYYVEINDNGCTSTRTAVTATVNATPTISSSTPASRCGTGTVTLGATGSAGTLSWFTAPTGGSAVGTGTSYTTPSLSTTTTYYVETTNNGCTSARTAVTATINLVPTVNAPANQTICFGNPSNAVNFAGNSGSTTYSWVNSNSSFGLAASGTGNIASFSPTGMGTANITVTPSLGGCTGTPQVFSIVVNSSVGVDPPANQLVCLGSASNSIVFTGSSGATFSWTNNNTGFGLAASGNGNIASFTPTALGTATITVTPALSGCAGVSEVFTFQVNPVPTVNTVANQNICLGNTTNAINFSGTAGSTYTWSNSNPSIGIAANGTGNILSFSPSAVGLATITVTPSLNGCTGTPRTFTLDVRPVPTVNSVANQTVCQGDAVAAINFSGSSGSSTYAWTNSNAAIGLSAGGNGNIASFTSLAAGTANITVTPTLNGCAGTPQSFSVLVKTTPTINALSNQTICLGDTTLDIVFTGNSGSTSYDWVSNNNSFGLALGGNGPISSFMPFDTGTAVITVTPSLNGCTGNDAVVTINVKAVPTLDAISNQSICQGDTAVAIDFTGSDPTAVYTWTNSNTTIGLSAGGNGNIAAFTTLAAGLANITVTPSSNGCVGTSSNFSILVNPIPTVTQTAFLTVCVGTAAFNLTGGSPANGTYSGQGVNNNSFDPAVSGTGTFPITYTVTENGCTGSTTTNITVDICGGIDNLGGALLLVYPNPTEAKLTIEGEQLKNFKKVELVDALGRVLQKWDLDNQLNLSISLDAFPSASYSLRFSGDKGTTIRKIVVRR